MRRTSALRVLADVSGTVAVGPSERSACRGGSSGRRALVAVLSTGALAAAATLPAAADARIGPGSQTWWPNRTQCTSNFVFADRWERLYLGQAAHCGSDSVDTDGCSVPPPERGAPVRIVGASRPGTLVYNSRRVMQEHGGFVGDVCTGNDFALVAIDPADYDLVDPSVPEWGGPHGIAPTPAINSRVYAWGNSAFRRSITEVSPQTGVVRGFSPLGFQVHVVLVTPGVPGDSGSPVLDAQGRALGVNITLGLHRDGGTNAVARLTKVLEFASEHGGPEGLRLEGGTQPFKGLPGR